MTSLTTSLDLALDGTQVAVLYIRVNVEHRLNVAMISDHGLNRVGHRSEIAEQLRLAAILHRNRRITNLFHGIQSDLRSLRGDQVRGSHLRVEVEVRLHLRTRRQGDEHAVGNVLRGEAELGGPRPIDVVVQIGTVHHLMHMRIHHTRNPSDFLPDLSSHVEVPGVVTGHLNVDRRRQPEVQDLRHNVRWLEIKQQRRKRTRQPLPQLRNIFRSRAVFAFFESDQNLAIEGADGGAIAEGKIERFGRAPDIVEDEFNFVRWDHAPEFLFNAAENELRTFQARSRGRPDMQSKLACIHARKEVAAYKGHQHEGGRDDGAR